MSTRNLSPSQFDSFISHDYGTPLGETNVVRYPSDEARVQDIMRTAKKHGFAKPARVDFQEDPPVLRDGHHRLEAARRLDIPLPTVDYWKSKSQDKPRTLP